jgi:hypothetical protein
LCLEGDLDKVPLLKLLGQAQQAAGHGNGLEFPSGAFTIFQHDEGKN